MDRGCGKMVLLGCGAFIGLLLVLVLAGFLGSYMLMSGPPEGDLSPVTELSGDCPKAAVLRYFGQREDRMSTILGPMGDIGGDSPEDSSLQEGLAQLDLAGTRQAFADFEAEYTPECLQGYKAAELEFHDAVLSQMEDLQADVEAGAGAWRATRTVFWLIRNIHPRIERLKEAQVAFEAEHGYDTSEMESLGLDWDPGTGD